MKQCENCSIEHDRSYGSGRFCSEKCARGFSTKDKRKEINKKVSEKLIGSSNWNKGLTYRIKNNKHVLIEPTRCKICNKKISYKSIINRCRDCMKKENFWSNYLKSTGNCGGYREGSNRHKGGWYKEDHYDSQFEIEIAKYLENNKINFVRNTKRIYFIFNERKTYYIPDFYLKDYDCYFETKGYWWRDSKERTQEAIKQNKINVIILMQKDWKNNKNVIIEKLSALSSNG